MSRTKIIILVAVAALLITPYFAFDKESKDMNAEARKTAPGKFVKLASGTTHYELGGPAAGPRVVLIHGFSIPMYVWDDAFKALTGAGFRVLRYDHLGRGYSDRPNVRYNPDLFDTHLVQLLDQLQWTKPVNVVGLSMGGAVAINFTARHPKRVNRLVLASPAGFPQKLPFMASLVQAPLIGDYLFRVVGDQSLLKRLPSNVHQPEKHQAFLDRFGHQMQYRGFKRALQSSMRHMQSVDFSPQFETVAKQKRAILAICGIQDHVIPKGNSDHLKRILKNATVHEFPDSGHLPQLEQSERFNSLMLAFLKAP